MDRQQATNLRRESYESSNLSGGPKICSKCREDKPLSEYTKNKRKKDGLNHSCKICHRKYVNEHYRKNKKYYKDKAKKQNKKVYKLIKELKENTPCADCGRQYPFYVMDFDHLKDKLFNVSWLAKTGQSKKLREEMRKCEIVCANCHRERTWNRTLEEH